MVNPLKSSHGPAISHNALLLEILISSDID